MKNTSTFLSLFALTFVLFINNANAQININVNVDALPEWAQTEYEPEIRYYYIPEMEVYYDIPSNIYIYYNKNGWVRTKKLPGKFKKHNLNTCYKVGLYDIGPSPYIYHDSHKKRFHKRKLQSKSEHYEPYKKNNK